jgi:hypothetical protein
MCGAVKSCVLDHNVIEKLVGFYYGVPGTEYRLLMR